MGETRRRGENYESFSFFLLPPHTIIVFQKKGVRGKDGGQVLYKQTSPIKARVAAQTAHLSSTYRVEKMRCLFLYANKNIFIIVQSIN